MEKIQISGFTFSPKFQKCHQTLLDLDVNENDVWICSHPKSGTTWTQEMVWMIGNNLDYEKAQKALEQRSPYLERSCLLDWVNLLENPSDTELPYLADSVKFVEQQPSPRYIKTHLPWIFLPKTIQNFEKRPKIIYISRNSKDVCTSYYYYARYFAGYNLSFNDFATMFFNGKTFYGDQWEHVLSYWKHSNEPNVLLIKYEDMKQDLPGIIQKVANFLEKTLNDQEMEILGKHLSFESMKTNQWINRNEIIKLYQNKHKLYDSNASFIRSGKIDGHKTMMSDELIKKFDEKTYEKFHQIDGLL